jgi:hypothetical protein
MKNDKLWMFLAVFIGVLSILQYAAHGGSGGSSGYGYTRPNYAINNPSYSNYYGLQDAGFGNGFLSLYTPGNSYPASGAANYAAGYGNIGRSPYLMPSYSYNPVFGYRQNYDSHIYIDNALDNTYYNNPQLFATRSMDNHQRYVRGLWPQKFYY